MRFTHFTALLTTLLAAMVSVQAKTLAPGYNREMIRGVNIGSWLVLEKWMCPSLFDTYASSAVDEWTFTETLGKDAAYTALQSHWSSWFTKDDVVSLKGMGINALRIPVGYWSFDLQDDEPYVWGAQDWLDTAIDWAREEGLYVWVDLHGVPGSQNGFDNSGRSGAMDWQTVDGNIARTHSVLKTIAKKYGASSYADVVIGIQLVNEPASWGNNSNDITRDFYNDGYGNVWAEVENGDMMVVIHDNFLPLSDWTNFQGPPAAGNLGIDTHIYQVFADSDNTLNQDGHVALACSKGDLLAAANAIVPVFTGEWSGATNICLLADGSTIAGTSCSEDGCQCESADSRTWSDGLIAQLRRFNEAQMDVWEETTSGYFFWNFKTEHAPAWDFMKGAQNGWIPQPLSDRQFPGQCGYTVDQYFIDSSASSSAAVSSTEVASSTAWEETSSTEAWTEATATAEATSTDAWTSAEATTTADAWTAAETTSDAWPSTSEYVVPTSTDAAASPTTTVVTYTTAAPAAAEITAAPAGGDYTYTVTNYYTFTGDAAATNTDGIANLGMDYTTTQTEYYTTEWTTATTTAYYRRVKRGRYGRS